MARTAKKDPSLAEMTGMVSEGLNRARSRPSVHAYVPHEKQIMFHSAPERVRLYIGGNRSGKTVGGVVEDIMWLRGQHPYRSVFPPPVRGRVVTVSLEEGIKKLIIPEVARWIPPSDLINGSWEDSYSKSERTLTLSNGSFVEFMTYEQEVEKFAGTSRHFIHFDEEPPQPIYNECRMRTLDVGGSMWITMTPLLGMTWIYDTIYLPGKAGGINIAVIQIDTMENPYLSQPEIEEVFGDITDDSEVKMRKQGEFVQIGGLVFKQFGIKKNTRPSLDLATLKKIRGWTHYGSLDHGYNNPTAWLWHAVSPNGLVVTYDELYANETLVADFARSIHERNKQEGRRAPDLYIGDPAISQRNGQTGDSIQLAYVKEGIPIVLGNNEVKIGIEKMNAYLGNVKWVITENCVNLIRELQRVRWKTYPSAKARYDNNKREEIHKKDDHAPDSARYMFGLMPTLELPPLFQIVNGRLNASEAVRVALSASTPPVGPENYDPNFKKSSNTQTEWSVIDEQMGGIF